jgi:hypothetical protein
MATWFFSVDGTPSYYQEGKHLFHAKTNECEFYEQDKFWFRMKSGESAFFIQDKWVFSIDGKASYYKS